MIAPFEIARGHLALEGIDLAELADAVGTPAYVYGSDAIAAAYRGLRAALPERVAIHYSVKANPALAVCALLSELGAKAEIASAGELAAALAAGFAGRDIVFAGPGKTDAELAAALAAGVSVVNAESAGELERLARAARAHGSRARACLRVNPRSGAESSRIKTGGGAQKFGVDEEQAAAVARRALADRDLDFAGFHVFTGSQVHSAHELLAGAQATLELAARLARELDFEPELVNFGGGLGVPYSQKDARFDVRAYAAGLSEALERSASGPLARARFQIEPGRYLVSEAGCYLARVLDVKTSGGRRFAILDGGIHHALLPITANAYRAVLANRAAESAEREVLVGGPLCTSADLTPFPLALPEVQPGDVVALLNSGAYGLSASMVLFLSHGLPAEVLIQAGRAHVIRERSRPEDLLAAQRLVGQARTLLDPSPASPR